MSNTKIGLLVDVETTGLSPYKDEIIEIAMIKFTFDKMTGEVLEILDTFSALREPKSHSAISNYKEAYKIHGIPFSKVKGKEFDDSVINNLINGVEYGFAHNASFDRSFVHFMYPILGEIKWHCSMKHVDWHGYGFENMKLLTLLKGHNLALDQSHRALDDVSLTLELIKCKSPAGSTYLKEILTKKPMRKYQPQYSSSSYQDLQNEQRWKHDRSAEVASTIEPHIRTSPTTKIRFYQKAWFAWVCILLMFTSPLGIFMMWKYSHHSKPVRIIATLVGLFFFIGIFTDSNN